MKSFILVVTISFMLIPSLQAQEKQAEEKGVSRTTQQEVPVSPSTQGTLPEAVRPGHPLDPADVDILTGKRDREIEASRRAAVPMLVGDYGAYGDLYAMNGRRGTTLNVPLLPLRRIGSPFFFFNMAPGSFGTRGFRRR